LAGRGRALSMLVGELQKDFGYAKTLFYRCGEGKIKTIQRAGRFGNAGRGRKDVQPRGAVCMLAPGFFWSGQRTKKTERTPMERVGFKS